MFYFGWKMYITMIKNSQIQYLKSAILLGILYFFLICNYSCQQIDESDLSGQSSEKAMTRDVDGNWVWKYPESHSGGRILHDGGNAEDLKHTNYLIFKDGKFTSIEYPCYIISRGDFSIQNDTILMVFEYWTEKVRFNSKENELILTKLINGEERQFLYKRTGLNEDSLVPQDFEQVELNNYSWCHYSYNWKFTGEKYNAKDVDIEHPEQSKLPPVLDFKTHKKGHFSFSKSLMCHYGDEGEYSFWVYHYDGEQLHIIPTKDHHSVEMLSDTVYVYKRIRKRT